MFTHASCDKILVYVGTIFARGIPVIRSMTKVDVLLTNFSKFNFQKNLYGHRHTKLCQNVAKGSYFMLNGQYLFWQCLVNFGNFFS